MPFPDRPQGKDDPNAAVCQPALVGVLNDAGVHQCRSGIAIFMTEIRTDQQFRLALEMLSVEAENRLHLFISFDKNLFYLPMTIGKITQDDA